MTLDTRGEADALAVIRKGEGDLTASSGRFVGERERERGRGIEVVRSGNGGRVRGDALRTTLDFTVAARLLVAEGVVERR